MRPISCPGNTIVGRLDQGGTFVMVPNTRSCPHIWSYYTVHFIGSKDLSFVLAIFYSGFYLIQNVHSLAHSEAPDSKYTSLSGMQHQHAFPNLLCCNGFTSMGTAIPSEMVRSSHRATFRFSLLLSSYTSGRMRRHLNTYCTIWKLEVGPLWLIGQIFVAMSVYLGKQTTQ